MVCDFMELYRYLIDDFVIGLCRDVKPRDFTVKKDMVGTRIAKRIFLNDETADDLIMKLLKFFDKRFPIPSVRRGSKIQLNTLINEESFRMWVYLLRTNKIEWSPKIPIP
jgi:hypothetical protein